MEDKDVVIIGGGPAGYVAAIRIAQLGGKPILIEKDTLGGNCLNRGCISVRALVKAAELVDLGKSGRDYGVNYQEASIDFLKMMARKDNIVKMVVSGVKLLLEGNKAEVINGAARFTSPTELDVQLSDGSSRRIATRRVIIATGSRCDKPEGPDKSTITTDEILALQQIPTSLLIVGGGFIGLAFATIFSRLGSKVTVVEESKRLLPEMDEEVVSIFEKELKKNKVQIYMGARVQTLSGKDSSPEPGQKVVLLDTNEEKVVDADLTLIAEVRKPNVEDLGLEKAGVTLNEKGGIGVNKRMETNVPGIFAAGDVTMDNMWTHVAYAEGIVAAENALGKGSMMDYSVIPLLTHTLPEIASIGLTEDEAVVQGHRIKVGRFPFAANAMATIIGQRTGMIKIIAEEKYGQILGAHVIGPQASNLISEIALAMRLEAMPNDIGLLMHGHPTLSEVCWEAARDVTGNTIHFMSQNR